MKQHPQHPIPYQLTSAMIAQIVSIGNTIASHMPEHTKAPNLSPMAQRQLNPGHPYQYNPTNS